jgi:phage terminase large subunit
VSLSAALLLRDDPVKFVKLMWPDIQLYAQEREILYSVRDNDETVVVAGNMLGKDYTAALCVLWFFLTRHPCRIVTTSADGYQLEAVLWGEIRRFIQSSAYPLESTKGGPLVVNHLHLRKVCNGSVDGLSYVLGRVAAKGEGMLGHHIANTGDGVPRTLAVADEASGVDDVSFQRFDTWASRKLLIGNAWPCSNYFFRAIEEGDVVEKPYTEITGDVFKKGV